MTVSDVTPAERAAWIVGRLYDKGELTTQDIARKCDVSVRTAQRDLLNVERVISIERQDGIVRLLNPKSF